MVTAEQAQGTRICIAGRDVRVAPWRHRVWRGAFFFVLGGAASATSACYVAKRGWRWHAGLGVAGACGSVGK